MSFLTDTGLAYFYNKLKSKFVQSVNGETVDDHGDVQINQVALAENLTSPDAQASIDSFVYRTSGGAASLTSGEANLVFINGNIDILDRTQESAFVTSNTTFNVSISSQNDLRNAVNNTTGIYLLTYTAPTNSSAIEIWEPNVNSWIYNNEATSLDLWGLTSDEVTAPILSIDAGGNLTSATVVPDTFVSEIKDNALGTYEFIYDGTNWKFNSTSITLSDYGIAITDTPTTNDIITVTYTPGTPSTTITINFQAYVPGLLRVATPTSFQATGFNQFDKTTMYIENATIEDNTIVANEGTYVCYCRAVGGEHGYIAESIDGHINITGGMGWCANVPEIGSTVITTSAKDDDSVTEYAADFTYMTNGYMVVVVDDMDDLMMWCEWSGDVNGQTEYIAYTAPSIITIPTVGSIEGIQYYLPTYTYGMPRLGTIYDTINFESNTYIKRIEQLDYSEANLALVQAMNPVPIYDYDSTNIFYVLNTPITYTFESDGGTFYVDDHGTEEFTGTVTNVTVELLYGQNLRDKLRTDVLTISEQNPPLTDTQINQVYNNLKLNGVRHLDYYDFDFKEGALVPNEEVVDTVSIMNGIVSNGWVLISFSFTTATDLTANTRYNFATISDTLYEKIGRTYRDLGIIETNKRIAAAIRVDTWSEDTQNIYFTPTAAYASGTYVVGSIIFPVSYNLPSNS